MKNICFYLIIIIVSWNYNIFCSMTFVQVDCEPISKIRKRRDFWIVSPTPTGICEWRFADNGGDYKLGRLVFVGRSAGMAWGQLSIRYICVTIVFYIRYIIPVSSQNLRTVDDWAIFFRVWPREFCVYVGLNERREFARGLFYCDIAWRWMFVGSAWLSRREA